MDRENVLVQPVGKSWPVRKINSVRLHKRRMYKPKLKAGLFLSSDEADEVEPNDFSTNRAHRSPEGVGGHIDFKA